MVSSWLLVTYGLLIGCLSVMYWLLVSYRLSIGSVIVSVLCMGDLLVMYGYSVGMYGLFSGYWLRMGSLLVLYWLCVDCLLFIGDFMDWLFSG